MKKVNFVYGHSSYGSLKYYFKENNIDEKIINFCDDLSIGKLGDKELRISELKKYFFAPSQWEDKLIKDMEIFFYQLTKINSKDELIVWVGDSVSEQMMLRFIVNKFGKTNSIKIIELDKIMSQSPVCLSMLDFDNINRCFNFKELIENSSQLTEEYLTCLKNQFSLRIYESKKIIEVGIDFYDEILKKKLKLYENVLRAIGAAMNEILEVYGEFISDGFMIYRAMSLNLPKVKKFYERYPEKF